LENQFANLATGVTTLSKSVLSIITVTYQAENTLPATLESVASNIAGLDVVEYIVVDGASTDGTPAIIREAAGQGLVQHWVSEPDRGIYDAMNKAVALASGAWILFMNAGDNFAATDTLQQLWPALADPSAPALDVLYGNCYMVMSDGEVRYDPARDPQEIRYRMVCSHQSLFARRELLVAHPFDLAYPVCADHHFLAQVIEAGAVVGMLDLPVARVVLERYTWQQIRDGHAQKWRSMRQVYPGIKTELAFAARFVRLALAALAKKLLGR